jgi:hypothetical protein
VTAPPAPTELFYSYSHRDEELRRRLETHLKPLQREGVISNWHDHMIDAGTEWKGQIDAHLNSAKVILLLISADFVASEYCYDIEMTRALERQAAGEARVIPIILRPVDWQGSPFARLQVLPTGGKPITSWANRDEAFLDVVHGIRLVYAVTESRLGLDPKEAIRQEGQQAGKGLNVLGSVVERGPRGREQAARFRSAFRAACAQVDILGDYKELHELLHDVQLGCYNPLLPRIKHGLRDEEEWAELVMYDQQLAGCVGRRGA